MTHDGMPRLAGLLHVKDLTVKELPLPHSPPTSARRRRFHRPMSGLRSLGAPVWGIRQLGSYTERSLDPQELERLGVTSPRPMSPRSRSRRSAGTSRLSSYDVRPNTAPTGREPTSRRKCPDSAARQQLEQIRLDLIQQEEGRDGSVHAKARTRIEGELEMMRWKSPGCVMPHNATRRVVSGGTFEVMDDIDIAADMGMFEDCEGTLTTLCLDKWMQTLASEETMFSSLAVFIEVKLREVKHATRNVSMPNSFRTAVACHMMHKLSSCLGRFHSVFVPVVQEIYASIYPDFKGDGSNVDSFRLTPFFVETKHLRSSMVILTGRISDLSTEIDIRKARSETTKVAVDGVVKNWQSSILFHSFSVWKAHVLRRKDKISKLNKFFRKSNQLKELFLRWRTTTSRSASMKLRKLQVKHQEMSIEYEDRMRTLSVERDTQKSALDIAQGKLQIAENDVVTLRQQMSMSTEEVVLEMKNKMSVFQVDYFRYAVSILGDRLRVAREEFISTFQAEWLNDAHMLLSPGEDSFTEANLLALVPEDLVLRWVNQRLTVIKDAKVPPVEDLSVSFQNGEVMILLMTLFAPQYISLHSLDDPDPRERLKDALTAATEIGANDGPLSMYIDMFENKADLTFVLLSRLMAMFPGMHPRKQTITEDLAEIDAMIFRWEKLRRSRKGKIPSELVLFTEAVEQIIVRTQNATQRLFARHRLWEAVIVKVSSLAYTMLASRMRGVPVVVNDARENVDLAQYKTIVRAKIEKLIPSELGSQEEIARIIIQLDKYAIANRRVFRHYAAGEGVGSTMSLNEFVKFVQDAKLVGKTLKLPQVERIFEIANSDVSGTAETEPVVEVAEVTELDTFAVDDGEDDYIDEDDVDNPDEELIPKEFVECLIRLACKKFTRPYSVADRLVLLMETFVLKNAMRSEKFREEICSVKVKDVFDRNRSCLRCIFRYYASGGKSTKAPKSKDKGKKAKESMNLVNFNLMVRECAWVDATFSLQHVQSIFSNIQRTDDDETNEVTTELVFDEFTEGLAAIAVMKIPNPYVELDTRIEQFLHTRLFAPLNKLNSITGLRKLIKIATSANAV